MEVSGTVYRAGTKERVLNATVKATGKGETQHVLTDDDGDFSFKNLQTGEWTLLAMQEEYFPSKPLKRSLTEDTPRLAGYPSRVAGENDQKAGYRFFGVLLGFFAAWPVLYIVLHSLLPWTREPVGLVLGDQVVTAIQHMGTVDKISQDKALLATVARTTANLDSALNATTILNQADKELLRQAAAKVAEDVQADDKAGAAEPLAFLQKELTTPARKAFTVWSTDPWRLLEIVLWGLAGVLVNKIIVAGWYLRSHRFTAKVS